jgi:hypothetical protein
MMKRLSLLDPIRRGPLESNDFGIRVKSRRKRRENDLTIKTLIGAALINTKGSATGIDFCAP